MGLLKYFGQSFFEEMVPSKTISLGQLCWLPVPHLNPQPYVIEGQRIDDKSHVAAKARWVTLNDEHFTRRTGKALPILGFNLGETEELLAFKAKRRLGVVVADGAQILGDKEAAPHHEENRIAVAPLYGLRTEEDPKGFTAVIAARTRHLLYRQFFPMQSWTEKRSPRPLDACSLEETVARFDRLQFVRPHPPGCRPIPLRVSQKAFDLLQACLWEYLGAPASKDVAELRELVAEDLPEEARPVA